MPAASVHLPLREWAEIHAEAERLGAPVAAVVREAWRIARDRILAAGARIEALRRSLPSPPPRERAPTLPPAPILPPVLPEPVAPARLPPAVLWRGWGDDDGPTI